MFVVLVLVPGGDLEFYHFTNDTVHDWDPVDPVPLIELNIFAAVDRTFQGSA